MVENQGLGTLIADILRFLFGWK